MNTKRFKLFQRPYSMTCIDDDTSFVELLAMSVPTAWDVHYFTKTNSCIAHLNAHSSLMLRDMSALKHVFKMPSEVKGVIGDVLHYWRQNPQRWGLCELGIFDFYMPKMNGLELLAEVRDWSGKRVLLTGFADDKTAVKAFNDSTIHHFLKKQDDALVDTLAQAFDQLSPYLHYAQHNLCQNQLNDTQAGLLKHELTSAALQSFAQTHWIEYMVLGNPFGILGMDAQGKTSWLQLERQCDIDDLKAIAAQEPWDALNKQAIANGEVLSNSLLRQALDNHIVPATARLNAFGEEGLLGAMFYFTPPDNLSSPVNYADWCKANKSVLIRDAD